MKMSNMTNSDDDQPNFDFELQRNVTVTAGQIGFLHCRVERLGDKDVSNFFKMHIIIYVCVEKECIICVVWYCIRDKATRKSGLRWFSTTYE